MYSIGRAFSLCLIIHLSDGRVYCQDTHASPWIPLGYTCPVMCQNILNAIERLKIMDYRKLIEEDRKKRDKINASYLKTLMNSISAETGTDKRQENEEISNDRNAKMSKRKERNNEKSLRYQEYVKNLKINQSKDKMDKQTGDLDIYIDNSIETGVETNKMASKQDGVLKKYETVTHNLKFEFEAINTGDNVDVEIKKEIGESAGKMATNHGHDLEQELKKVLENSTCNWFRSEQPYVLIKKIIRSCEGGSRRNGYGEDFLRTLTRTMNRFSEASFEFTEDMVELVLERVFGKKVEFREEMFDVDKLLRYLRNAVEMHKQHTERDTIIVLKPRHCLSLSMPGCFCRPGFVESSGQCVRPSDCVPDPSNEVYLSRIVVH